MTKVEKSWIVVVVCALLLGTFVGVVWARPNDRPETRDITRKITIPGAFFHPHEHGDYWHNEGFEIEVPSGASIFTAPVVFPCLPSVTVERLILYVEDNNGSANACAYLYRTRPPKGDQAQMGQICSSGTTLVVEPFIDSSINPNVVWPGHGAYIRLEIDGPSVYVHGVRVEYHRNI